MRPLKIKRTTTALIIDTGNNKAVLNYLRPICTRLTQKNSHWDNRQKRMVSTVMAHWFRYEKHTGKILFPAYIEHELLGSLEQQRVPFEIEKVKPNTAITNGMAVSDKFSYRKGQEKFVEFLTTWPSTTRILPATMGAGKTVSSLVSIAKMQMNALGVVPASVVDEFIETIQWATNLTKEDYIYIAGGDSLRAYMQQIIEGPNPYAMTLISIKTLQMFINDYADNDYPLTPFEFFEKGGFGVKLVDEAHKNQHFHMITNLYSNIEVNIYLTATLMKEGDFERIIENLQYPDKDKCPVPPATNHVLLRAYHYEFKPKVPPHLGMMGYNHAKMEKGIEKFKRSLVPYLQMVYAILKRDFIDVRVKGDRALIFFSKTTMVVAACALLEKLHPELSIINYKAGDRKAVLREADIIVSTVKKAGTGTDIPQLTYVLQTIPISAKGENFQNVGRLRNIDAKDTTFAYLVCDNIPKHVEYHSKRQRELIPLVHKRENINYPHSIPFH